MFAPGRPPAHRGTAPTRPWNPTLRGAKTGCPGGVRASTTCQVKHDSPEFAAIAEQGTILRCQVGSGLHGTAVLGQDDRDELGI